MVTGRKGRGEGKKGRSSSKAYHFVTGKVIRRVTASARVVEKKEARSETDVALSGVEDTQVLMASYENNTSQGKSWIFDSGNTVHLCSQKELFNSLVAKEEVIVKMVDDSACKVISTGTVKVTERDGTVCALEVIRYYPGGTLQSNITAVLIKKDSRFKVTPQLAKET